MHHGTKITFIMNYYEFIEQYEPCREKTGFMPMQKLISACVFATRIVQRLLFLNPKFQVSSRFLRLYRPVCVGPDRKPRRPVFSCHGSYHSDRNHNLLHLFPRSTCIFLPYLGVYHLNYVEVKFVLHFWQCPIIVPYME